MVCIPCLIYPIGTFLMFIVGVLMNYYNKFIERNQSKKAEKLEESTKNEKNKLQNDDGFDNQDSDHKKDKLD